MFWPLLRTLAVSMAVARQVQTLILQEKIEKSGREGGLGWGCKVDGHMPWGALSGSPRVLGHERVFWGRCGGFSAPVAQYLQYMRILIIYLRIHTNTHKYLLIHTYRRQLNTDCSNILIPYRQILADTCRKIPTAYLHIHAIPTYTYTAHTYR